MLFIYEGSNSNIRPIFYTFPPFLPTGPRIYAGFRAIIRKTANSVVPRNRHYMLDRKDNVG